MHDSKILCITARYCVLQQDIVFLIQIRMYVVSDEFRTQIACLYMAFVLFSIW